MKRLFQLRMWQIWLMSAGMLLAQAWGVKVGGAEASGPPVVARLDVLSTPTLGGTGQVIWAAIPNVAPQAADLVLTLRRGSAVKRQELVHLKLAQSQPTERYFNFSAPDPGKYRVDAILFLRLNGALSKYNYSLTLDLPAQGRPWLESMEPPVIVPLAVNGAPARGDLPTSAAEAWFSFDVPTTATHTMEVISGGSPSMSLQLYGPDRQSALLAAADGPRQPGVTPQLTLRLGPGTYYVKARNTNPAAGGVFQLQVYNRPIPIGPFLINGGERSTLNPNVILNTRFRGGPVKLIASYQSSFWGAVWQPYTPAAPYKLPAGGELRTVYLKVKDALGRVSGVMTQRIQVIGCEGLSINANDAYGSIHDSGNPQWHNFELATTTTVSIETRLGTLSELVVKLYGPNSGTLWLEQFRIKGNEKTGAIRRRLGPGTYYLKAVGIAPATGGSYQIRVRVAPVIRSLALNCGEAATYDPVVMINASLDSIYGIFPVYGYPQLEYIASERPDFRGSGWTLMPPLPEFGLTELSGLKRVYFKVRIGEGNESPVTSATIELKPQPLAWGAPPLADSIRAPHVTEDTYYGGDGDLMPSYPMARWYTFTLAQPALSNIEILGVTGYHPRAADTYMRLFGPGDKSKLLAEDDDSGMDVSSRITRRLEAGTYYVKVQPRHQGEFMNYQIVLNGDDSPRVSGLHLYPNPVKPLGAPQAPGAASAGLADHLLATTRTLYITNSVSGNPTRLMISESPVFRNAQWQPYDSQVTFTLAPGTGLKTVYLKVRDAAGKVSAPVSASVMLVDGTHLVSSAASLNGSISQAGEADWYVIRTRDYVKVELTPGTLKDAVVTYYRGDTTTILEQAQGVRGQKITFKQYIQGDDSGTYLGNHGFALIKITAKTPSATGSYTLRLAKGKYISVEANGEATVTTHDVKINYEAMGAPTQYLISEAADFRGATWKALPQGQIPFTLSAGNGLKSYYLKVRDAAGFESGVAEGWMYVEGVRALTVNGPAVTDYCPWRADWFDEPYFNPQFSFTVPSTGTYQLDVQGTDSLPEYFIDIAGTGSVKTFNAHYAIQGKLLTAALENLKPGTYTITLYPGWPPDPYQDGVASFGGRFTIRIARNQGEPILTRFVLNQGINTTMRGEVWLNATATGSPAWYMASESPTFAGAQWKAWQTTLTLTLSPGEGQKTVYLKLKSQSGRESNVMSAGVYRVIPVPLTLDGPKLHGPFDGECYSLRVDRETRIKFDVEGHYIVFLYAPDGYTCLNYGRWDLLNRVYQPGTYYIGIYSIALRETEDEYSLFDHGPYTIQATSAAPLGTVYRIQGGW